MSSHPTISPLIAPTPPTASFDGAAAAGWFASKGYRTTLNPALQLFADSTAVNGFRMARIWNTEATLTLDHANQQPGASLMFLLLVIEGEATVSGTDWSLTLPAGSTFFMEKERIGTISSTTHLARMEFDLGRSLFGQRHFLRRPRVDAISPESPYIKTLINLANSVFNAGIGLRDPGATNFRMAVEHLVLAAIREAEDRRRNRVSSTGSHVFDRALQIIEMEAMSPEFTVATLAHRLHLSEQYVRRSFATAGTSASSEIRSLRTRLARNLLTAKGPTSAAEREEIARTTGFRSSRAMRNAIAVQDKHDTRAVCEVDTPG